MAEKGHTELLPCPFCGVVPEIARWEWPSVFCIQCGNDDCAVGSETSSVTEVEAITSWNTRTAVNTYPAVEGLVKALELLLHVRGTSEDTPGVRDQAESALSRFRSLQRGGVE